MSTVPGLVSRLVVRRSEEFTLDVDLTIAPGTTVALLGPNGSGKSTAVASLAGLLAIDDGKIVVDDVLLDDPGVDIFVPADERQVGVVFQDYALFPHLSVAENVAFGLRSRGVRRRQALRRANEWLARLDLGELAERRPPDLSGGQAQRAAIARALIIEPRLLLLDEPLAALDVTTRVRLRRTLAEHLRDFDGPRLLITHDPTEAFLLADEIAVLEDGIVTQRGTAEDLRIHPRTRYVADLVGSNFLVGDALDGVLSIDGHSLRVADTGVSGSTVVSIHPRAIALHRREPDGSPRNAWRAQVTLIEDMGERVRVDVGGPLPVTAEITPEAADALGLCPGAEVWLSVKATEIAVEPA